MSLVEQSEEWQNKKDVIELNKSEEVSEISEVNESQLSFNFEYSKEAEVEVFDFDDDIPF